MCEVIDGDGNVKVRRYVVEVMDESYSDPCKPRCIEFNRKANAIRHAKKEVEVHGPYRVDIYNTVKDDIVLGWK